MYGKLLPDTLRMEEALAELALALELEPYSVSLHKDIGEVLHFSGRHDEAVKYFEKALELEPGYPSAYFWLTRCCDLLGRATKPSRSTCTGWVPLFSRRMGRGSMPKRCESWKRPIDGVGGRSTDGLRSPE